MNLKKLALTVFGLAGVASAATIYVSPVGTAGAAGTLAAPKDLASAITTIAAGDVYEASPVQYFKFELILEFPGKTVNGDKGSSQVV